jgi:hypothetical protein
LEEKEDKGHSRPARDSSPALAGLSISQRCAAVGPREGDLVRIGRLSGKDGRS